HSPRFGISRGSRLPRQVDVEVEPHPVVRIDHVGALYTREAYHRVPMSRGRRDALQDTVRLEVDAGRQRAFLDHRRAEHLWVAALDARRHTQEVAYGAGDRAIVEGVDKRGAPDREDDPQRTGISPAGPSPASSPHRTYPRKASGIISAATRSRLGA